MRWVKCDDYCLMSADERFAINRAGMGTTFAYTAVKLGTRWRNGKGWDGSEAIHVERDTPKDDEAARKAAVQRCQAACEAAAHV